MAQTERRFWTKVNKTPGGCWIWVGSRDGHGYGMFRVGPNRVRRAHRVAYEFVNGPVPDGTVFLHSCDNPPCVNPEHVQPGTRAENVVDRDAKGRHWTHRGEDHGMAKLTAEAVAEIRSTPRSYGICRALADRFGVAVGTIYQLRSASSKTWKGTAA